MTGGIDDQRRRGHQIKTALLQVEPSAVFFTVVFSASGTVTNAKQTRAHLLFYWAAATECTEEEEQSW